MKETARMLELILFAKMEQLRQRLYLRQAVYIRRTNASVCAYINYSVPSL